MGTGPHPITSECLGKVLVDAGIVPPNCQRAIIDIAYCNVVKVYYECTGDERLLEVDWSPLEGIGVRVGNTEKGEENGRAQAG